MDAGDDEARAKVWLVRPDVELLRAAIEEDDPWLEDLDVELGNTENGLELANRLEVIEKPVDDIPELEFNAIVWKLLDRSEAVIVEPIEAGAVLEFSLGGTDTTESVLLDSGKEVEIRKVVEGVDEVVAMLKLYICRKLPAPHHSNWFPGHCMLQLDWTEAVLPPAMGPAPYQHSLPYSTPKY